MKPEFWLERWQRNEIGFHQSQPHRALGAHWHRLNLAPGARVFVPLAGKSLDMLWLARKGCEVVGIELAQQAVEAFFAERGIRPEVRLLASGERGNLRRYSDGAITLFSGNIFDLTPQILGPIAAVFDRAALVALPPSMRADYAGQLQRLSPPGTPMLLVTLEYDQAVTPGPPHSVEETEVGALYGSRYQIRLLDRIDQLADLPKFAERGVKQLNEACWLLT